MRSLEEIKKEQDQAIYNLGTHMVLSEQWKAKILALAEEANQLPKVEPIPTPAPIQDPPIDLNK